MDTDATPSDPRAIPGLATGRGASHVDDARETVAANRRWWDAEADTYYAEHGTFLGDDDLVWGPEGITEANVGLLGDVTGLDVLEIGCGAAQGGRHVAGLGARVVACDVSGGMVRRGAAIDATRAETAPRPHLLQADACALPFADSAFDVVFSAYGAVPFVADSLGLMRECARVLRPGGRLVFSTTHPTGGPSPTCPARPD